MPRPPRVCHLTSAHGASDIRVFQKECRSLAQAGYDVSLVVPHPADGVADGVNLLAVRKSEGRLARMTLTVLRVFRRAWRLDADLYHFHDPELLPVGFALKLMGKKVVYDAHENLPEDIRVKRYLRPSVRSTLAWLATLVEAAAGAVLDGVVTVVPAIAARFPAGKTVVVANYPLVDELPSGTGPGPTPGAPTTLVYTGGLSEFRGILEMVRATELVNRTHPARLLLAGSFTHAEYEARVKAEPGWRYVDYRGHVPSKAAMELMGSADIGLLLFLPSPHNIESSPNKLFEYLGFRLPVVMSDFPYWRRHLDPHRCGLFVDPTATEAVAAAITWLIEHPREAGAMGDRGQRAVQDSFNWQAEARTLLDLYEKLLGGPHGRIA